MQQSSDDTPSVLCLSENASTNEETGDIAEDAQNAETNKEVESDQRTKGWSFLCQCACHLSSKSHATRHEGPNRRHQPRRENKGARKKTKDRLKGRDYRTNNREKRACDFFSPFYVPYFIQKELNC